MLNLQGFHLQPRLKLFSFWIYETNGIVSDIKITQFFLQIRMPHGRRVLSRISTDLSGNTSPKALILTILAMKRSWKSNIRSIENLVKNYNSCRQSKPWIEKFRNFALASWLCHSFSLSVHFAYYIFLINFASLRKRLWKPQYRGSTALLPDIRHFLKDTQISKKTCLPVNPYSPQYI